MLYSETFIKRMIKYLLLKKRIMIIIVCGLPGVGKSYFAKELAKRLDAGYVSSDQIRMDILHERTYSQEEKDRIYGIMADLAKKQLKESNVILDATFYLKKYRDMMCKIAQEKGAECRIIECVLDEDELKARLEKRKTEKTESEADFEIHEKVKHDFEPITDEHLTIDTADPIEENISKAIEWIRNR